jgi:serine/threonine-protein kinase
VVRAAHDVGRLVIGKRRGRRYELLARIGVGTTGAVYRASEVGGAIKREVCLKRLGACSEAAARDMWEEARLLGRIRHCNVVGLLDVGQEESGEPFLVLELVRGANLRTLCSIAGRAGLSPEAALLPERVAVHIACAILRGLAGAQRTIPGLVHRDVSPTNVLVSSEGEVKLTDFGIALANDRARWTRSSLLKGKWGYVAPEQARGERLAPSADLFAVGVLLYELLTRRRPWAGRTLVEQLAAMRCGSLVPLQQLRPDLDFGLIRAVERCLELHSHDRYACAEDALRALAPYSAGDLASLRISELLRYCARAATLEGRP